MILKFLVKDIMIKKHLVLKIGILIFLIIGSFVSLIYAGDRVIYKGQDLEITREDVLNLKDYYESNTPYRTNAKEYLKNALQISLFTNEAKKLGLIENSNISDLDFQSKTHRKVIISKLYERYLLDNYKIQDNVILSFYRSNPHKFKVQSKNGTNKCLTIDAVPKKERNVIKRHILNSKKSHIISDQFTKLKNKYNIEKLMEIRSL